jgi:hypothetical protein
LIDFFGTPRRELFNLREDPGETSNLVLRRPEIGARLFAQLDAWRKQTGAIMPTRNPHADPGWPGWQLTGEERPTPPLPALAPTSSGRKS